MNVSFYFVISEKSDTFAFLNQKVYPSRAHFQTWSTRPLRRCAFAFELRTTSIRSQTPTGNRNSTPARMAESVDALVSNTSGAIRAGSIPAPGTRKWPTDTCRPFLYLIFPTFSPHLTIILQKVFRFFCLYCTHFGLDPHPFRKKRFHPLFQS